MAAFAERDPCAVAGYPHVSDPPIRFVERLADRILQPDLLANQAGDGELCAVRRPVGRLHVLEEVAGGAPLEPGHRERSRLIEKRREARVAQKRELALR